MSPRTLKIWRCSIYFYIILFGISGVLMGIVTSYFLIQSFSMRTFYDPLQTSIYFLYGPTFLIFLAAVLGWKAVKKKNSTLLKLFSVFQALIIVMELVGSVWNFTSMKILDKTALPLFESRFTELTKDQNSHNWDIIQRKLKCCGIHGAYDYKTMNIVPFSCCNQASKGQYPAFCVSLHHVGCLEAFSDDISVHFAVLATVTIVTAFFQVPGVFASWFYANRLRRERYVDGNNKACLLNKNTTVQVS